MDKQNNPQFPNRFTLLMTGPTVGLVGEYGKTWDGHMGEYERINVVVEGAPMKLEDSEQYLQQMKGISTAALGYWKEGDKIHPDYDTPALHDVARLYAKYAALHEFSESVRNTVTAGGAVDTGMLPVAKVLIFGETVTLQDARLGILKRLDGKSLFARVQDIRKIPSVFSGAPQAFLNAFNTEYRKAETPSELGNQAHPGSSVAQAAQADEARDAALEEVAQEIDSYADSSLEGEQLEAAITFVKLIRAIKRTTAADNQKGPDDA